MKQTALLPPSMEEKIPEKLPVRVANDAVERIIVSYCWQRTKAEGLQAINQLMRDHAHNLEDSRLRSMP